MGDEGEEESLHFRRELRLSQHSTEAVSGSRLSAVISPFSLQSRAQWEPLGVNFLCTRASVFSPFSSFILYVCLARFFFFANR